MEQKFYICNHCGNIIAFVENKGVPVFCCGQKMTYIEPNVTDASIEKHVPQYVVKDNTVEVTIGSTLHPMTEGHHISWVSLETDKGNQRKILEKTGAPFVAFALTEGEKFRAVYAYCNLHGLWKA